MRTNTWLTLLKSKSPWNLGTHLISIAGIAAQGSISLLLSASHFWQKDECILQLRRTPWHIPAPWFWQVIEYNSSVGPSMACECVCYLPKSRTGKSRAVRGARPCANSRRMHTLVLPPQYKEGRVPSAHMFPQSLAVLLIVHVSAKVCLSMLILMTAWKNRQDPTP